MINPSLSSLSSLSSPLPLRARRPLCPPPNRWTLPIWPLVTGQHFETPVVSSMSRATTRQHSCFQHTSPSPSTIITTRIINCDLAKDGINNQAPVLRVCLELIGIMRSIHRIFVCIRCFRACNLLRFPQPFLDLEMYDDATVISLVAGAAWIQELFSCTRDSCLLQAWIELRPIGCFLARQIWGSLSNTCDHVMQFPFASLSLKARRGDQNRLDGDARSDGRRLCLTSPEGKGKSMCENRIVVAWCFHICFAMCRRTEMVCSVAPVLLPYE